MRLARGSVEEAAIGPAKRGQRDEAGQDAAAGRRLDGDPLGFVRAASFRI